MGSVTLTSTNPFLVELPEPFDMPNRDDSSWECPNCGHTHDQDEWTTREVHIGDVDYSVEECPWCSNCYPPDNLPGSSYWRCADCGEQYSSSHEAMHCCPGDPCSAPDGHCVCRDGIPREERSNGLYASRESYAFDTLFHCCCDDDGECSYLVCVVCHCAYLGEQQAKQYHRCTGDPAAETLDVGRPASLGALAAEVTSDSCLCDSGFCCEKHDRHQRPHIMCTRAG